MIHEHDKDKRAFTFGKVGATGEIKCSAGGRHFGHKSPFPRWGSSVDHNAWAKAFNSTRVFMGSSSLRVVANVFKTTDITLT